MLRLIDAPDCYAWPDAAQLIKHAFGLAGTFGGPPATLLYLYWEPANPDVNRPQVHRRLICFSYAARSDLSRAA
jgi:hypothetical protein